MRLNRLRLKWILKERVPVPCDDLIEWGLWMRDSPDRIVGDTDVDEDVRVSTVFLGLDHAFSDDPETMGIFFETMVFGEEKTGLWNGKPYSYREDLGQWRYNTWAQAVEGHERACARMHERLAEAAALVSQTLKT